MTLTMTGTIVGGVLAHGVGGRGALPLPFDLLVRGAAVTLLVTFLALGLLWRTPRLRAGAAGRPLPPTAQRVIDSSALRVILRGCGLVATGYVALAAVFGRADALNPFPYVVYVLFWVGLVPASLLLGPVWRRLNPLRPLHAALAWMLRVDPHRGLVALPPWLGYWPAAVSLASFVWLELAAPGGATVPVLRVYCGIYIAVHLTAAVVFGSRWFTTGDGFEVYSSLIGTLSPWGRRGDGQLVVRNPLDGAATIGPTPGIVAVIAVLLGSTAFDSLSSSAAWVRITQGLPLPPVLPATLGLLVMIAVVAVTFGAGAAVAGQLGQRGRTPLPGAMAHTIIPIIVGYLIAHYFSYLLFQGQQAIILLSDPLGIGANWLGTYDNGVDFSLVAPAVVALVQAGAVVTGHILGVISAHDRAVALFPRQQAITGQLPLLVLMVGYTIGGLYLLYAT